MERAICAVMASASPPGMPAMETDSCWSIMESASLELSLSSKPLFMVAWRMLLIISCMNSDSNCLAASRAACGLFALAWLFRLLSELMSVASALLVFIMLISPPARHSKHLRP